MLATLLAAAPAIPSGLCAAAETTYFSCSTGKQRWIGLCGHAPQDLHYRFGRNGQIELDFPDRATTNTTPFRVAHYVRFQTDRIEVTFRNRDVDYVLFDYSEMARRQAGVRVRDANDKEAEIPCTAQLVSRLGELEGRLPCDPDNALADCAPE